MEAALEQHLLISIDSYEQLLTIIDKKRESLINNDMEKLQEFALNEQTFIKKISEQEKEFITMLGEKKVSEVIAKMSDRDKKAKAEQLLIKLENVAVEIREKNEIIKVLLKDALQFSQFMRGQLLEQTQINYGNPSKKSNNLAQNKGFFDTKA